MSPWARQGIHVHTARLTRKAGATRPVAAAPSISVTFFFPSLQSPFSSLTHLVSNDASSLTTPKPQTNHTKTSHSIASAFLDSHGRGTDGISAPPGPVARPTRRAAALRRTCNAPNGRRHLVAPAPDAFDGVLSLRLAADTNVASIDVSISEPRSPGSATHRGKYACQQPER